MAEEGNYHQHHEQPASPFQFPFYAKLALIFVGAYIFIDAMYLGRGIILPILYAAVISIVLNPVVAFLERCKVRRILAITIAVLISLIFAAIIIYIVTSQVSMIADTLPKMQTKLDDLLSQVSHWAIKNMGANVEKMNDWRAKTKSDIFSSGNSIIGQTLITLGGLLEILILVPVYVFMILYYQPLLLEFMGKLFSRHHKQQVEEVMLQTKAIIQSYLTGLLIEALIVGTLNTTALFVIGIQYALLLGITGALLNVVPFIGGLLSVLAPVVLTVVTRDDSYAPVLWILLAYALIQFFDNHYITPKIVASKVRVNALIAVVAVLIGGAIWGIPGMFLSIPLTAIVKVICEHINPLKPWAFLLGDTMPISARLLFNFSKKKQGKRKDRAYKLK